MSGGNPRDLVPAREWSRGSGRFRSDVQALRAVAVAAVVVYHLWPRHLPGGFVGVDVFFVISGFLITSQLADELRRTHRISLTQFWARRIRRLLPAAFTVLAVCVAILVLLMPVLTWRQNLQEIRAAAAYGENWLLAAHAVDYLAAEDSASLVQHYWSLSVEEQFYLLWPLLILLGVALSRALRRRHWRTVQLCVLGALTVTSFVVSLRLTDAHPAAAFFATPARAWEFAVGGLVALATTDRDHNWSSAFRGGASWLGFGLIAYSAATITGEQGFPGMVALLPVSGAALVLAAGDPRSCWSPRPVTRLRPVQWLGDHSYSLYLWHWPLVVALPWALHGPMSSRTRALAAAASVVLAWVTQRYVEDPVRTGRRWRSRTWPAYGLAVAGVVAVLATTVLPAVRVERVDAAVRSRLAAQDQGDADLQPLPGPRRPERRAPGRQRARSVAAAVSCDGAAAMDPRNRCSRPFTRPADVDTAFAASDGRGYRCLQGTGATVPAPCTFGRSRSPGRTIALVGNSHAARLAPALDLYGKHQGWRILLAAKIDCMGQSTAPVGAQSAEDPCVRWSAALQRQLLSMPDLDAVVFASHIGAKAYLAGVDAPDSAVRSARQRVLATWSALTRRGVRVIVVEDVPGMRPENDPECLARSRARYDPCAVSRSAVVRPNLLTSLAQENPRLARYIPLTRFFCDQTKCHGVIGGVVVYYDSHHVTTTYARSLAPYLGAEVSAALPRPRHRTVHRPR